LPDLSGGHQKVISSRHDKEENDGTGSLRIFEGTAKVPVCGKEKGNHEGGDSKGSDRWGVNG